MFIFAFFRSRCMLPTETAFVIFLSISLLFLVLVNQRASLWLAKRKETLRWFEWWKACCLLSWWGLASGEVTSCECNESEVWEKMSWQSLATARLHITCKQILFLFVTWLWSSPIPTSHTCAGDRFTLFNRRMIIFRLRTEAKISQKMFLIDRALSKLQSAWSVRVVGFFVVA